MKAAIAGFFQKYTRTAVCLLAFVLLLASMTALAQDPKGSLVITQVYPAGAQNYAAYLNDYVEIFNASQNDIDLTNWSIVMGNASSDKPDATGSLAIGSTSSHEMVAAKGCVQTASTVANTSASICYANGFNGILKPGQYMLILVKGKSPVGSQAPPPQMPVTPDLDLANVGCSVATPPGAVSEAVCPGALTIAGGTSKQFSGSTNGWIGLVNQSISGNLGITGGCASPFSSTPNATSDFVGYYFPTKAVPTCAAGTAVLASGSGAAPRGPLFAVWRGGNDGVTNHDCPNLLNPFNNATDFSPIQIGGSTTTAPASYPPSPNWVLHNTTSKTVYQDLNATAPSGTTEYNVAEFTTTSYTPTACGTGPQPIPPKVVLTASIPTAAQHDGTNDSEAEIITATVTPGQYPTSQSGSLKVQGDMSYLGGAQNQDFGTGVGPDGNGNYVFTWTGTLNTNPSNNLPYVATLNVTADDDQSLAGLRAAGKGSTTITINPQPHGCSIPTGDFWTAPGFYGTTGAGSPPASTPQYCNIGDATCTPWLSAMVTKPYPTSNSITSVTGADMTACSGGLAPQPLAVVTGGGTTGAGLYNYACALPTGKAGAYPFHVDVLDKDGSTCAGDMTFYVGEATNPSVVLTANPVALDIASADPTSTNVTITATVTPGANPSSTGFSKSKMCFDMTAIGGKASSCFTDAGPDGNGNEVLTYQGTIPNGPNATLGPLTIPAITVTDGQGRTGTSSQLVLNINSAPIATSIAIEVAADSDCSTSANNFILSATGGTTPYTYTVLSLPAQGALSGTAPNQCYTPTAGVMSGSDSFQYEITDAAGVTSTATVSVSITTAPVGSATPNSGTVYNTDTLPIVLAGSGGAGGPYTYTVATQPTLGTLSATSGTLPATITYTPQSSSVSGVDSFTFYVSDASSANSTPVPVTVNVVAAPVAAPQSQSVPYESAGSRITLSASGGIPPYTYTYTQPANGALTGTAPNLTYKPNTAFTGLDPFTFSAADSNGKTSNTATVSVTVNAPAPCVAQPISLTLPYATAGQITLTATGATPYTFSFTQPGNGTVSGTAPNVTYTPKTTFYGGSDTFTYTCSNPGGAGASAPVNITVLAPTAPIAVNTQMTAPFGTATVSVLNAINGVLPYNYTVVSQPANGTLSASQGSLSSPPTYTPSYSVVCDPNLQKLPVPICATDSFTYSVTDSASSTSNTAKVSINISNPIISLNGAGGTPPAAQTVSAGQTATYNLQLAGWPGASGTATLTCTGAPVPCTATPNSVTLNGTTAVPFSVAVVTKNPSAASGFVSVPGTPGGWPGMLMIALAGLAGIFMMFRNRKLQWRFVGACAVLLIVVGGLSSCGVNQGKTWATPSGSYTLLVTATSGSAQGTFPLTLKVN